MQTKKVQTKESASLPARVLTGKDTGIELTETELKKVSGGKYWKFHEYM